MNIRPPFHDNSLSRFCISRPLKTSILAVSKSSSFLVSNGMLYSSSFGSDRHSLASCKSPCRLLLDVSRSLSLADADRGPSMGCLACGQQWQMVEWYSVLPTTVCCIASLALILCLCHAHVNYTAQCRIHVYVYLYRQSRGDTSLKSQHLVFYSILY